MKKRRILTGVLAAAMILSASTTAFAGIEDVKVQNPVKNVIVMIPDGMSVDVTTLARWYNDGKDLNLDALASGLVRTYSADAPIADSAPAGTAMATGYKSHTGYVGVLPDENTMPGLSALKEEDKKRPVASVLEAAQLAGKATGMVATSEIMHATPADFSAHYPSRKNYDAISEQQVYQEMDVVIGGGEKFFTEAERGDKEDLVSVLKKEYQYVTSVADFNKVNSGKLWAMFAGADVSYEFDRDKNAQPSLAEMTAKAIELLSQDKDGFFLVVEGSKIDWAAHANDPIGLISDTLAFDEAVGIALDFAKKDGNTLLVSATDHGNSGITIGNKATDNTYDKTKLEAFINPLKKASLTGEGVEKKLNADRSNIKEVMSKYFGITDLTTAEVAEIKAAEAGTLNYTVGPMIGKRANIGFTTNGHTGEDVPLYVYAPKNITMLTGTVENTDIAEYMAMAMGVNLAKTTETLFVPARAAFEAKGAAVSVDQSDSKNWVLVVTKGNTTIEMPVNKNIAYVNGTEQKLDGVVVYNEISFYVPQSAVNLIK